MSDEVESLRDESNTLKAKKLVLEARTSTNQIAEFSVDALERLELAVNLDPALVGAWLDLATCYQRKLDIVKAIECLETALQHCNPDKPSKLVLRRLSACIRQKPCESQEEKITTLLRSLDLSKQALKADLKDAENYYNLAKAYMCLFFATECVDQRLIILSRSAFSKAIELSLENTKKASTTTISLAKEVALDYDDIHPIETEQMKPFMQQADFLFNYSTVLLYLQEFEKALELIEASVALEPDWDEPRLLGENIVSYLKQTYSMIDELSRHPKRVVKRFNKVVESLKEVARMENLIKLDQRRLTKIEDVLIEARTLRELGCDKMNKGILSGPSSDQHPATGSAHIKVAHLKLLELISYNQAMYLTFLAIDREYSLIVVTIYNLAASKCPTQRDVLTIIEPKIERIQVEGLKDTTGKIHNVSFDRINVREFRELYVNGFRISVDQVSKPQFRVSLIP